MLRNMPLMVAMIAHEMYTWKVELDTTSRASCNVEHSRMLRICEVFYLL